ncbi:MAG: hypothetical protein ACKVQU_29555 [Burkholderiales bacterium]
MNVSQSELAKVFNVDPQTIRRWQSDGLPHKKRSSMSEPHRYDVSVCAVWYLRREEARRGRRETGSAMLLFAQNARLRVEIEAFHAAVGAMPDLASDLEAATGAEAKRAVLRAYGEKVLRDVEAKGLGE